MHARLKQAGSAWLADNAHSIAQLRIIRANHQWDDFWLPRIAA
ncbi:MAG TPA: hypothetical protein VIT91_12715 [Chthoniobacterales bacterium]